MPRRCSTVYIMLRGITCRSTYIYICIAHTRYFIFLVADMIPKRFKNKNNTLFQVRRRHMHLAIDAYRARWYILHALARRTRENKNQCGAARPYNIYELVIISYTRRYSEHRPRAGVYAAPIPCNEGTMRHAVTYGSESVLNAIYFVVFFAHRHIRSRKLMPSISTICSTTIFKIIYIF